MAKKVIINKGDKYANLTLTGNSKSINNRVYFEYECKCSKKGWTRRSTIMNGTSKSCGCLIKESIILRSTTHGLSKHPLYFIWKDMNTRCYNEMSSRYTYYGGYGVTVCDEWRNNFKCFYDWAIDNGWQKGLELDKDKLSNSQTGKIYSPQFCSWLTHKNNMKYRRNSKVIEYMGKHKSLIEWCEILNLDYGLVHKRLNQCKWDICKAFETPKRKREKIYDTTL